MKKYILINALLLSLAVSQSTVMAAGVSTGNHNTVIAPETEKTLNVYGEHNTVYAANTYVYGRNNNLGQGQPSTAISYVSSSSVIGQDNTVDYARRNTIIGRNWTVTGTVPAANDTALDSLAASNVLIGDNTSKVAINTLSHIVSIGANTAPISSNSVYLGSGSTNANADSSAGLTAYNAETITYADGGTLDLSFSGAGSEKTGLVSIGATGKERRLQNVAAGKISENSTDAINGSQLYSVLNNMKWSLTTAGNTDTAGTTSTVTANETVTISGGTNINVSQAGNTITINTSDNVATVDQITKVENGLTTSLNKIEDDISKTAANSAALSALKPLQYDPLEPTQIMVGAGGYKGTHALALGLAHYKNESTLFHAGVSIGNHNTMYNVGATWKFGNRDEEEAVPDRYKAGPISSVYVIQDEISAIKAQNSLLLAENKQQKIQIDEQQHKINAQQDEIDTMKAQIKMLLNKVGM